VRTTYLVIMSFLPVLSSCAVRTSRAPSPPMSTELTAFDERASYLLVPRYDVRSTGFPMIGTYPIFGKRCSSVRAIGVSVFSGPIPISTLQAPTVHRPPFEAIKNVPVAMPPFAKPMNQPQEKPTGDGVWQTPQGQAHIPPASPTVQPHNTYSQPSNGIPIIDLRDQCTSGNDPKACRGLAQTYLQGKKNNQKPAYAAKLLAKACAGKDAEGCAMLSEMYSTGDVIPKDPWKATNYKALACQNGLQDYCI
jgi:hypothetical protein